MSVYAVWKREFNLVFHDAGVLIFFLFLPTLYPVIYTLIYNPEVVTNLPVVVVDKCGTARSREFTRDVNATQAIEVAGFATSLAEAREAMNEHRVYAIMEIPADFDKQIGRGEQATVPVYYDMSLLLRYRTMLMALADIQIAEGAKFRAETIDNLGLPAEGVSAASGAPINSESLFLGDPTQGFASFVIPGILVLILQQSLILGAAMLAGGSAERRRLNGGIDPMIVDAPPTATLFGKTFCYLVIYLPLMLYLFHGVPTMFNLPHVGHLGQYMLFMLPLVLASSLLGIVLGIFVTERENSLMIIVFTSVIFLFLSGLTWPRYGMSPFWRAVGDLVPATWGIEGFIRMNSNGATLGQEARPYLWLWCLTGLYFVIAYLIIRYRRARQRRLLAASQTAA
ncbi:MAG: ABC transporter permease [Muribaculaceae bacterium]|nr:ABC transporter permease [Muribaculaceae bacterium]